MEQNQNQSNINEVEAFFNNNSTQQVITSGEDDGKSLKERDLLFGINFENLGAENFDLWIKYTSQSEENFRKLEELKSEIHIKKEELLQKTLNSASERSLRERNAKLAFDFAKWWAIFIGAFILLHGFNGITVHIFKLSFNISETEFIFVCGTLTASILIFYLTVIKNLFPNKQ